MLKIKSHNRKPELSAHVLPEGKHIVRVESVTETSAKSDGPWADSTPQIAIKYKGNGFITQWVNLKGYMTSADFEDDTAQKFAKHPISGIMYAIDENNCRVEDEQKTLTCLHILGRIANCCGFSSGEEVDIQDLVGKELMIEVSKIGKQLKVTKTYKKQEHGI